MFDIGFPELILVSVVALLVMGPERLPEALRTLGLWIGRARRSFTAVKDEIEKEIGMDEVRRQLHNEAVMEEMKRIERDIKAEIDPLARKDHLANQEPGQVHATATPATPESHTSHAADSPDSPEVSEETTEDHRILPSS